MRPDKPDKAGQAVFVRPRTLRRDRTDRTDTLISVRPVRAVLAPFERRRGRVSVSLAWMVAAKRDSQWLTHSPSAAFLRSEEHTSELQSLMRISYAVFCLKKKTKKYNTHTQ